MACVINCRFCQNTAIDHDHNKCAAKFGDEISQAFDLCRKYSIPIPEKVAQEMKKPEWTWYLEYLRRIEKDLELIRELEKLKITVRKFIDDLVDENSDGIKKLNPAGHTINIETRVKVAAKDRCL